MKLTMKTRFIAIAAALLVAGAAHIHAADTRIGLIDLKRVFDGYYKTRQADAQLKERVTDSEKVLKGMLEDHQKVTEDYKKLVDSSNDQAVSNDERDKRKKNAETKLLELQEIERSVKQFRTQTQTTLEEQKRRMREEILRYLREVIATHAKKGNYSLVLDTASESISQTSVILYTDGQNDITADVLQEINANAPAETPKAADAKPESKLPEVLAEPSKKK